MTLSCFIYHGIAQRILHHAHTKKKKSGLIKTHEWNRQSPKCAGYAVTREERPCHIVYNCQGRHQQAGERGGGSPSLSNVGVIHIIWRAPLPPPPPNTHTFGEIFGKFELLR